MNIKKMVALVATGALAASLALFGCSSGDGQDSGAKDDKAAGNESGYTLVNDGKLTVAASLDFPPFENLNGDTPRGLRGGAHGPSAEEMGLESTTCRPRSSTPSFLSSRPAARPMWVCPASPSPPSAWTRSTSPTPCAT